MWMLPYGFYDERQKRVRNAGWRIWCHMLVAVLVLAGLSSCATIAKRPPHHNTLVYAPSLNASLVQQFAPIFVVEKGDISHNRIGTPAVATKHEGHEGQKGREVFVDPEWATIYTEVREFTTQRGEYTNLVYRVHFSGTPFSLVPFYLGAGKNIGLLVVVTLDSTQNPVLYTLVHTCGCYLAFVATSHLDEKMWKTGWNSGRQSVYGENLPRLVSLDSHPKKRLAVQLAPATHRVKNVWPATAEALRHYSFVPVRWQPLEALENLRRSDGSVTSFYETSGPRFGYVKDSGKIWERLLISWWALDWHVGEDKKLGRHTDDGIVFYTSLKPWARKESDLRDFARFLRYWGWSL